MKEQKKEKVKKLSFLKKVWYSITKFEKYVEMASEGTLRAVKYLVQLTSILVLVIATVSLYDVNIKLNRFIENVQKNLPEFSYAEGNVELASDVENKTYTLQDTDLNFGKVIIDLNTEDENIVGEYEKTIKDDNETNNMGYIILKDEVRQVAKLPNGVEGETTLSMTYDEIMTGVFENSDIEFTKSTLIQFLNGNGRTSILTVNFFSYFIAYFIIYASSTLIYALVLALIGFTSAKIAKIKLKLNQIWAMSVYSFTLSTILQLIYLVVNYITGITIKYFNIAYIAIAYIYLVAVMFLIKTDYLKKQENKVKEEEKEEKKEENGQEQI